MNNMINDEDQDFFTDREKKVALYEARWDQGLEIFTGKPLVGGSLIDCLESQDPKFREKNNLPNTL